MATGEKSFAFGSVDKKKRTFEPFPAGDYDLKVLGDTVEIRTPEPSKENPNPVSYVACGFEALGSASEEGGKNRRVYHNFFCKLAPGKDGIVTPTCVDQLKGFADAINDQPEIAIIQQAGQDVLSQLAIKKFLQSHDGDVVRAHVGIQKGTAKYPDPKNNIKEFLESEGSEKDEESDDEEDEDEDTDEDEDDDDEEDSDSDDDSDDDEDDSDDLKAAAKKKAAKKKGKK